MDNAEDPYVMNWQDFRCFAKHSYVPTYDSFPQLSTLHIFELYSQYFNHLGIGHAAWLCEASICLKAQLNYTNSIVAIDIPVKLPLCFEQSF